MAIAKPGDLVLAGPPWLTLLYVDGVDADGSIFASYPGDHHSHQRRLQPTDVVSVYAGTAGPRKK